MANRTIKDAKTIHGTNPQYLIEKIIRTRIYECRYWKEECFALNAELVVDKGIELRYIGGIYGGNIKPTPFICLTLKLLQIQPFKDIIIEFIRQEDFKYVRALGAFYLRLTGSSLEVWKYLEPLYNDYRKLRIMDRMGKFSVIHMDEFIDLLLRDDRVFDVILPRISKRQIHEESGELENRVSVLEEDLNAMESGEEIDSDIEANVKSSVTSKSKHIEQKEYRYEDKRERSKYSSPTRRRSRSRSPKRRKSPSYKRRSSSRDRDRRDRERNRKREHSYDRHQRRRSKSPKRKEKKKELTEEEIKQEEIKQQNILRAKLGMKPLRP